MELFSITCTTCHSRLKVRERAILGQIVACPKCHAMVLVEPPAGWVDPGESAAPVADATPAVAASATPAPATTTTFDDAAHLLERRAEPAPPPIPTAPAAP